MNLSKWFLKNLACPDCSSSLILADAFHCQHCGYSRPSSGIEFKPDSPQTLSLNFARKIDSTADDLLKNLELAPPDITYEGPAAIRDSRELISQIQQYLNPKDKVLDLGCGPRDQATPIEHLGFKYVGIDYSNPKADLIADAHALPFQSSLFDCVLSYAVLEHLHNPFIAINEIQRVLKPGGIYVGTVSQGEPFHDSYFHHTAWGLLSLINSTSNMRVIRLWPSRDTLAALASMGRYPRIIRKLIFAIHFLHDRCPFLAPRKMRWPTAEKNLDQLHRTGSVCFVIQKREC